MWEYDRNSVADTSRKFHNDRFDRFLATLQWWQHQGEQTNKQTNTHTQTTQNNTPTAIHRATQKGECLRQNYSAGLMALILNCASSACSRFTASRLWSLTGCSLFVVGGTCLLSHCTIPQCETGDDHEWLGSLYRGAHTTLACCLALPCIYRFICRWASHWMCVFSVYLFT